MNRYLLATLAATLLIGGASAREVAYCDAGFDIAILTGDKAVCQKKTKEWKFHSNRLCTPGLNYKAAKEATDGGDICTDGTGIIDVPALPCGIGERMVLKHNERDVCQKQEDVTAFGNIKTRVE